MRTHYQSISGRDWFDNRSRLLHSRAMAESTFALHTAYISLGSNLGEPEANLKAAATGLAGLPGCELERVSSIYLTEPQGLKEQPWFANQVAQLRCGPGLDAPGLLQNLLDLEVRLGRVRSGQIPPNSPRGIDLDLLLFGEQICSTPELVLPHPRLTQRAFVLIPLLEIAPDLRLPGGAALSSFLDQLPCRLDGRKIYQP